MPRAEVAPGPVPEGRDPQEFDRLRRRVLWSLPTGLFVVGSRSGHRCNLMTANWVMQIATSPKLVAVSVEREAETRRLIDEGGGFSVSVLAREDRSVVRRFVKPVAEVAHDTDGRVTSMQGEQVRLVAGGLPCLAAALGWLACTVREAHTWEHLSSPDRPGRSSHVLFIGEVVDAGERGPEALEEAVLRMEDTRMNYGG